MASYQPQIINVQPQPTILDYLGQGIQQGGNRYMDAMMKQKMEEFEETRKQKKYDASKAAAIANGLNIEESYSSTGPSWKTVTEKPLNFSDLKMGAAGALPQNKYAQIGKTMNIEPEMLPPEETPGAAMSMAQGGVGDVRGNPLAPVQADYGQTVMKALSKNPVINPIRSQSKTELPSTFAQDFKVAHDTAAGNPDQFVANLTNLAMQYADNPVVLRQVKSLIDLNKPKKSKKTGSLSRLRE